MKGTNKIKTLLVKRKWVLKSKGEKPAEKLVDEC